MKWDVEMENNLTYFNYSPAIHHLLDHQKCSDSKKQQKAKKLNKFPVLDDEQITVTSPPFVKAPHGREHLIIAKSARMDSPPRDDWQRDQPKGVGRGQVSSNWTAASTVWTIISYNQKVFTQ